MSGFSELFARRVPQILGLYVAGTWMAIEIGDWLIEKFGLPESLTAIIFVALAAFLPAVALMAWNHGAPGRDLWTRTEKVFVPINMVAAAAAAFMVGQAPAPEAVAPTQMKTMVDEMGESQTFEVPVDRFHKRIALFFLSDDLADDDDAKWLSYGLPSLVAHDLNHETPLVKAITPFTATSLKELLAQRGYADARGAPSALQLSIARDHNNNALLAGSLNRADDGTLQATMRLVDVATGNETLNETFAFTDPLAAADAVSQRVQNLLDIDPRGDMENDPLTENFTANLEAARFAIEGIRRIELGNDYPSGIARLRESVELDDTFAEALGWLANYLFLNGDAAGSNDALAKALKLDYKLSTSSRLLFKARSYVYKNEFDRGLKVLQLWTEIEPSNSYAFELLGRILSVTGLSHDGAIDALTRALALNPSHVTLYSNLAEIEQARGRYGAAAEYVRKYIEARPEDSKAYVLLARVFTAANDFEQAREAYLDAELLSSDDLDVALGIASLDIRSGEFDAAEQRIADIVQRELSPQQRVAALNTRAELEYGRGQLRAMLATLDELDTVSASFLPPMLRVIQVGMNVVNAQSLLGDTDTARAGLSTMRQTMQPPFDGFLHVPSMMVAWKAGDYDAAVTALEQAEEFARSRNDPSYAAVLEYGRAHGAAYAQDTDKLITHVDNATRMLDQSILAASGSSMIALEYQVDLARLLLDAGAFEPSRKLVERILKRAPFLATAHLVLAQLWLDLEDTQRARASLDTALAIWAQADDDYIRVVEARSLQARLTP